MMVFDQWKRAMSDPRASGVDAPPPVPAENKSEAVREVETNLYNALRELEPQLLAMGIYKVGAETIATAKAPLEGLEISIRGTIDSIDVIGVDFWYKDGRTKTVSIDGWAEEGNHVSGAATQEAFKERIEKELGIVDQSTTFAEQVTQAVEPGAAESEPLKGRDYLSFVAEVKRAREGTMTEEEFLDDDFLLPDDKYVKIVVPTDPEVQRSELDKKQAFAFNVVLASDPDIIAVAVIIPKWLVTRGDRVITSKAEIVKKLIADKLDMVVRERIQQSLDIVVPSKEANILLSVS